jgi:LuxR family transcriptional regulator, maltose regulon positive regulatory protein
VSSAPGPSLSSRTARTPRRGAPPAGTLVAVHPPPAPALEVIESKLQVPALRLGTVSRTALVNRLRVEHSAPVVTVVAPAGYGKTTLVAQWAARDERPFAWVSLDERDNEPIVLLRHVAAALHRIEPLEHAVLDALLVPGDSIWTAAVPRLTAALAAVPEPFVFALDGTQVLRPGESADVVAVLVDHVPSGSRLVLSGRVAPPVPIGRLRAAGRLFELGTDELALTGREAQLLLRGAGREPAMAELGELVRRTEGWAAGLYLATLAAQTGAPAVGGDDRYFADYFRSEYLSGLTAERLAFLRRASVLKTMSGPLCDGVLDRTGSALELASLRASNLFLVPLDRRGESYRYHHLFHDLLRRELEEQEPELVSVLNRRAADWFEAHGDPESALGHAEASGDTDRAARLLSEAALPAYFHGRAAALERWLDRFDDEKRLERYPGVAVNGACVHALRGRASGAWRPQSTPPRGRGAAPVREPCEAASPR